jgi:hypothetical protein
MHVRNKRGEATILLLGGIVLFMGVLTWLSERPPDAQRSIKGQENVQHRPASDGASQGGNHAGHH